MNEENTTPVSTGEHSTAKERKRVKPESPINSEQLESLLTIQQEQLAKQQKQIELLLKAADKHRIQQNTPDDHGPKQVRVRTYKGKPVVKWELAQDFVDPNKPDDFNAQTIKITCADGKTHEMTYYNFGVVYYASTSGVVVSETKTKSRDKNGKPIDLITYTVEVDGQEVDIDEGFIN